ncbi:hypothetical protein [Rhodococcus koreensis]|uniref:hypothetical protein n=1 Tax=Rhodococcus koreensis TaxID=99653 RepID=UPI003670FDB5
MTTDGGQDTTAQSESDCDARVSISEPPGDSPGYGILCVREEMEEPLLPPVEYVLTVPDGTQEMRLDIARPRRVGGHTPGDVKFQRNLFTMIGGIAVAAGHVEMAMKQLYVSVANSEFDLKSVGGDMWQQLEEKLLTLCDDTSGQRRDLKSLIDWSKSEQLRDRRNDVIHGYWWTYDIGSVRNVRYRRSGSGALMRGSLHDLADIGEKLFVYANKLEKLCGDNWPHAILARGGVRPSADPNAEFPIELFSEVVSG